VVAGWLDGCASNSHSVLFGRDCRGVLIYGWLFRQSVCPSASPSYAVTLVRFVRVTNGFLTWISHLRLTGVTPGSRPPILKGVVVILQ
jgi:hypothetical protein